MIINNRTHRALFLAAALCLSPAVAQTSGSGQKSASANLIKRIPAGYRLINEVRGDLNGDGEDDCVLIIRATDKKMFERYNEDDPDSPLLDYNRGGVMIFFKDGNDYRLALENRRCFEAEGFGFEENVYRTPILSVQIRKGNLYFSFEDGRAKEGWLKYTFRYLNSEFELIGYDEGGPYGCEITSINFLTKKQLVRNCILEEGERCLGPCSDDEEKKTWSNIIIKKSAPLREIVTFDVYYSNSSRYIIKATPYK